jgi:hypothetical protein
LATGVASWSTTAATNSSADSAVNWAEGQAPSSVNDSARAMMASVAKWRDDLSGAITTAGTSTAYTATTNQSFASLSALDNRIITIVPHTTSGAAPTLAVDSLTAKAINISTGVAVPTGFLVAGTPYVVYYEAGVGEYIILGTPGAFKAISGTTGTFSSTLAVTGVSTFSDDLRAANGSTASPSYSFTNATNWGIYYDATNIVTTIAGVDIGFFWASGLTVTGTIRATTAVTSDASIVATTSISAASVTGDMVATQANQETATSTTTVVTPGRQHFHPSASKCWLKCDNAGNVNASYNITSITDTGTGVVTVTIATDLSSAHYALLVSGGTDILYSAPSTSQAAGSFVIRGVNPGTGNVQDSILGYYAVCFGDI